MGIPAPSSNGEGGGAPFLKAMHISQKGETKLVLVGPATVTEGQYGEQILIPCKVGKKDFIFPVKVDSGNHSRLFARFGANDKKWKGPITVKVAQHLGKDYVQVQD